MPFIIFEFTSVLIVFHTYDKNWCVQLLFSLNLVLFSLFSLHYRKWRCETITSRWVTYFRIGDDTVFFLPFRVLLSRTSFQCSELIRTRGKWWPNRWQRNRRHVYKHSWRSRSACGHARLRACGHAWRRRERERKNTGETSQRTQDAEEKNKEIRQNI